MKKLSLLLILCLVSTMLFACSINISTGNTSSTTESDEEKADEYVGDYMTDNLDTVSIEVNDDKDDMDYPYPYEIEIEITRLCDMEGYANPVDGALEFTVTDPNGNEMCGNFHPSSENDGKYTITITQSTWDLLPKQTEIIGFDKF